MQTILTATQTLSIYSINNSTGGIDDKSSSDWKSGTLDWSAPSTIGSGEGFEQIGLKNLTFFFKKKFFSRFFIRK